MMPLPSVSDKIQAFIHLEYYIILTIVLFFGLGFYKFHLTQISEKRHKNLQARFRSTVYFLDVVIQDIMSTLQNSGVPLAMNKISYARIPE